MNLKIISTKIPAFVLLASVLTVSTPYAAIASAAELSSHYTYHAPQLGASSIHPGYSKIIAKVSPSVVGIVGVPTPEAMAEEAGSDDGGYGQDKEGIAFGSGVIIASNGWIVTNAHVIDSMQEGAKVITSEANGQSKAYLVKEVYSDTVSDLALIKINATGLKAASFISGSQKPEVGEQVIAIGTPLSLSLRNSATSGIISGVNRAVDASYSLLQTDAAINPGNSGGPLVNMDGKVIGINTMKYEALGVDNLGFTIPADTVEYIIDQLYTYGEVRRASIGVQLEESEDALIGMPTNDAMKVTEVTSASAKKAGIKEGDVLYSINGKRVHTTVELNELLKAYTPGQTVKLMMQSGGDIVSRTLKLVQAQPEDLLDSSQADEATSPEQ
ncbi:S1C family serine protease [Paenibacillus sp. Z6-24]